MDPRPSAGQSREKRLSQWTRNIRRRALRFRRRNVGLISRLGGALSARMPKGLLVRSILIVVLPIVILQSVVAYIFLERHWQLVTRRLSSALTRDIAAVIEIADSYPQEPDYRTLTRIAAEQLQLNVTFLPPGPLPRPAARSWFSLLDGTLSRELTARVGKPFWIDTVGRSELIEIRIKLDKANLRIFARRSRTYASNSHIFLVWMVGASIVIVVIALLFLRNQITPIVQLAVAAERYGKGRPIGEIRPRGAREVRKASLAFQEMAERIDRQIEQRTMMLSGVSHDLRTILARFRLELAFLGDNEHTVAMRHDIDEMTRMLEDYLAFAKGDAGEPARTVDAAAIISDAAEDARRHGRSVTVHYDGEKSLTVRAGGFKRMLDNLLGNAVKLANHIEIHAARSAEALTIIVDDDGPGIPESDREAVFKPFHRLDAARNIDAGGTGLGLAITRDIARSHGGDILIDESPLGGVRAVLTIPA